MCYVYLIKSDNAVKIGVSNNPQSRLITLQTSHHQKLELIYQLQCADQTSAYNVESLLHKRYKSYNVSGEWFSLDAETVIHDLEFALSIGVFVSGRNFHKTETVTQEIIDTRPFFFIQWIIRLIASMRSLRINSQHNREFANRRKSSKQLQKALDWLGSNKAATVREAAHLAGVSVGTMHDAMQRQQKGQ